MKNEPKVLISAKVKPSTLNAIKADAEKDDRTVSYIAAQILDNYYKPKKDKMDEFQETIDTNMSLKGELLDAYFDTFWDAGMRKIGKKKAQSLFNKIILKLGYTYAGSFTGNLVRDIQKRLKINQLGFAEMHPTTYLNGERWNDEIREPTNGQAKSTFDELTDKTWAVGIVDALKQ